jgi:hypothetical protein
LLYHDPSNLNAMEVGLSGRSHPGCDSFLLMSSFSNSFCSFLPLEIESSHARVKVLQGFRHVIVCAYRAKILFSWGVHEELGFLLNGSWRFAAGLAWGTDEQTLKEAFSSFGEVLDGTEAYDSNPVSLLSKIGVYHSFYVFFSRFFVLSLKWMMTRFYFLCSQDHLWQRYW